MPLSVIRRRKNRGVIFIQPGFGFVAYKNVDAANQVLADYQKHYFGEKWVECKLSYPKDLANTSDQDNKKGNNSRSNKQYSSPFHSNEDYAQMHSEEDRYGVYNEHNRYDVPPKVPLRFSPKREPHEDTQETYGMGHYGYNSYTNPYQYAYPTGPSMGYQFTPHNHGFPGGYMYGRPPSMAVPLKQEVYRNLNNEISHKPMNSKLLKTGSHAVGSCHSELHMVANSDDGMRRMFPLSRGYSNYMSDFTQQKTQQTIVPPKRVLNRIGTFDFAYNKEESPGAEKKPDPRNDYDAARFMFQNMKSSSLHPEDFQRMEYRAAHLSPSRIKVSPNTEFAPSNRLLILNGTAGYQGQQPSKQQTKPLKLDKVKPKKEDSED